MKKIYVLLILTTLLFSCWNTEEKLDEVNNISEVDNAEDLKLKQENDKLLWDLQKDEVEQVKKQSLENLDMKLETEKNILLNQINKDIAANKKEFLDSFTSSDKNSDDIKKIELKLIDEKFEEIRNNEIERLEKEYEDEKSKSIEDIERMESELNNNQENN